MLRLFILLVLFAQTFVVWSQDFLHEGDLLFCVSSKGNAITDVTQGIDGSLIDHVGIVHRANDSIFVLEAIHKGVVLSPLDSFLVSNDSLVIVARLRDTTGVASSVNRAMRYLGRPYDFLFMPDDSAMYCSELVQKTYRNGAGHALFGIIPMSFHDTTCAVTPYWKEYYARRGKNVPEGEPGSNPGQLSRSKKIRILGRFKDLCSSQLRR